MGQSRQAISSVLLRIEDAASRVKIGGSYRAAYFDEDDGQQGIFLLFFKPHSRPDFTAAIKFDRLVANWTVERIASAAQESIEETMGMLP